MSDNSVQAGHDVAGFAVGDRVCKPNGYPFDSTVVAVFAKLDGQTRLVCESDAIPGMLHIFSPNQLDPMRNQDGA